MTGTHQYQRIADDLRGRIRRGELEGRLPNEKSLATEYGVAAQTMRSALDLLKHEGLISRKTKVGTWVNAAGKFLRDGPGRLRSRSKQFIAADIDDRPYQVTKFRSGVRNAQEEESVLASCFGLSTPLVYRERVYEAEGEPVYMATSYMPQKLFPDRGEVVLRKESGPGGVWGRLEEAHHRVMEAEEYVESRPATAQEARLLKLPTGSWVLVVTRPCEDKDGEVVDLAVITLPASRWVLRYPVKGKGLR